MQVEVGQAMNAVTKRKLPKFKPLKRKTKQRLRILFYIASLGLAFLIQTSVFPLIPFLAASMTAFCCISSNCIPVFFSIS